MLRKLLALIAAILVLSLLALAVVVARQRPPAIDGSNGEGEPLAWWTQKAIQGMFDYRVWSGARSGYIAMFARQGEIVYATSAGHADVERGIPMRLDTRLRIASLTKPITAVAAMTLVEDGVLGLDDTVAKYIPSAADLRVATRHERNADGGFDTVPLSSPMRVRHLLMFASGIGGSRSIGDDSDLGALWQEQGVSGGSGSLQQRVEHALTLPLFEEPGNVWRYGGSADVLARVMEVATGQPFPEILRQRLFEPLGMVRTEHLPPPERQVDLARVYTQDENGDLVLVPNRIGEWRDWTPGGGGLVSTVGDIMRFGLMMRNRGSLEGVRILEPETVAEMTRPHIESGVLVDQGLEGLGWGLGMSVVVDSEASIPIDRDGDFWWAGYYGTYWAVSPEADLVAVVFSQNEPGPYSDLPFVLGAAVSVALAGL
jgi:CubicO group peptidase (beta-lactamase class C family)